MLKRKKIILIVTAVFLIVLVGAGRIWLRSKYIVPILMYHHVDDNWRGNKLSVSPQSFKRQMEYLKKHNYNVMPLAELVTALKSGQKLPAKTVAVTFDDGYEDNYLEAFPVLSVLKLPATFFVTVNSIGAQGYMNWGQVRNLAESGIIDIGSHTLNHAWLPSKEGPELTAEIFDSKKRLEEETGRKIEMFSYPLGGLDDKVKGMVREAGYTGACATNPDIDFRNCNKKIPHFVRHNRFLLPGKEFSVVQGEFYTFLDCKKHEPYALARLRISSTSDNLFVFAVEISGYYNWVKSIRDEK